MRDFRDAKVMAQTLRDELKTKGISLTHSDSLELVAKTLGLHDWNTLAAKIQSERKPLDDEPATGGTSRREITLDASILDRYVGFYQPHANQVFTITRDGNRLITRFTGQKIPVPFYPESDTEFFAKMALVDIVGLEARYGQPLEGVSLSVRAGELHVNDQINFITDGEGQAESLILHQRHKDMPMKRIDAATAHKIEERRAVWERTATGIPMSGGE
jgi:hypothetical protein